MQLLPLEVLHKKALTYAKTDTAWHFHLLSPTCLFNSEKRFAFIVEMPEKNESFVYYSDKPQKELGAELSPLLHKFAAQPSEPAPPTINGMAIVERAKVLHEQNIAWHHHVLFPGCIFNKRSPSFVLTLEDPITGSVMESVTEYEPKGDLQYMEPLFYAQKN